MHFVSQHHLTTLSQNFVFIYNIVLAYLLNYSHTIYLFIFQLNGITTLGENVADNGGLKTSYNAYHTWLGAHAFKDPLPALPGLNMTQDQMFFLGFAQVT